MDENLFCEETGCGSAAHTFGFVNEMKWKACELHVQSLLQQKAPVYDIAAFPFINTPADGLRYREWASQKQISLESTCERDWKEGEKRLQEIGEAAHNVVQQTFQDMWQRTRQCYEEKKKQLSERKRNIDAFGLD